MYISFQQYFTKISQHKAHMENDLIDSFFGNALLTAGKFWSIGKPRTMGTSYISLVCVKVGPFHLKTTISTVILS